MKFTSFKLAHWCGAAVAAIASLSCSSGDQPNLSGKGGTAPVVVLGMRIESPEGRKIYVGAFADLPVGKVGTENMAEFGNVYMSAFAGHLYVFDRDSYEVRKFGFTDDRQFVDEGRLSFAAYGSGFEFGNAFASEELALIPHVPTDQLIAWNPKLMTIISAKPLNLPVRKGLDTYPGDPVISGGHVLWPLISTNEDAGTLYPTMAALIVSVDGSAAPKLIEDERCLPAIQGYGTSKGDIYLIGDGYSGDSNYWLKDKESPPACILRIRAKADQFDGKYLLDMNVATGSRAISQYFKLDDTHVLLRVFDPDLPLPDYDGYRTSNKFVAKLIDLSAPTAKAEDFPSIPQGGVTSNVQTSVDGVSYLEIPKDSGRGNRVYELRTGGIEPAFEIPGDLWVFSRLR